MKHFHVAVAHKSFAGIETLLPILAKHAKNDEQLVTVAGNMLRRKYPGIRKQIYLQRENLLVQECRDPKCLTEPKQQKLF